MIYKNEAQDALNELGESEEEESPERKEAEGNLEDALLALVEQIQSALKMADVG